jgi:hypothetical protein
MGRSDSDDEDDGLNIPKGVLRRKGGWEGDDLEWERSRSTTIDPKVSAAVDLKQFRNEEVGKGYQAKHVVRQPSATRDHNFRIEDMTTKTTRSSKKGKRKDSSSATKKRDRDQEDQFSSKLAKYLNCESFCKFRQEIEKMV